MRRNSIFKNPKISALVTPFSSALFSLAIMLAVLAIFAFIITKIDATDFMLSAMSTAALCIGAYVGGICKWKEKT